jgi:hypothetical protein
MSGGEIPTIIDPDKYKLRFKKAMKRYFVGMCIQDEKTSGTKGTTEKQDIDDEYESDEEEDAETTYAKNEKIESSVAMSNSVLIKTETCERDNTEPSE